MNKRILYYLLGLAVLSLGISLNAQTEMGLSTITSVSYIWTQLSGINLSVTTFLFNLILCAIQILLYWTKGSIPWLRVALQIPAALVSSIFIEFFLRIIPNFASLEAGHPIGSFSIRFILLILALILIGIGASLMIHAQFAPLPPDGTLVAMNTHLTTWNIGTIKNLFDALCAVITFTVAFIFKTNMHGIGLGTLIGIVLVGQVMRWNTKHLLPKLPLQ